MDYTVAHVTLELATELSQENFYVDHACKITSFPTRALHDNLRNYEVKVVSNSVV